MVCAAHNGPLALWSLIAPLGLCSLGGPGCQSPNSAVRWLCLGFPSAVGTGPGDLVFTELGAPVVFTPREKLPLAGP